MLVRDAMTEGPLTVEPTTAVSEVVEALQTVDFRHLPVVERGALVGMISDRDLRGLLLPQLVDEAALGQIKARYAAPVSELMSSGVITTHAEASMQEAAALMVENSVGALPVVEPSSGNLVGIISYVDILRHLGELLDD